MKRTLWLSTRVLPIFALALVALLAGCKRDPNIQKQKYLESGERYFKSAKYREAVIQFSNALQVDPRFVEGHYQLAQTYIKLQDWSMAYEQLEKTIELRPDHYPAQIDLANLLVANRSLDRAKEHLDVLAAKDPQDPKFHLALANYLAAKDDLPAALMEMQKAVDGAPGNVDSLLSLALLQVRASQTDAA